MRRILPLLLGAALLSAAAPYPKGEARLAEAVRGRVAGEPVDCINLRAVRSTQVIDRTAIVYDAGRTLYVNRPRGGAEGLNRFDALVTRNFDSRLCSVDVVRLYDTGGRFTRGFIFLGDFIPYRKAR